MKNKTYDIMKYVVMIFLPALTVYIPKLFEVWGIPYGEAIGQTLTITQVFLGTILCINSEIYKRRTK